MYSDDMRLFFGVELSDGARRAAADFALAARGFWPGKYADPANYHMTLCFMGMVSPERLGEVKQVGRLAASALPEKRLALEKAGHFGKKDKAILYLYPSGGECYAPLAQTLRDLLKEANLPFDPKPFSPHITLARNACLSDEGPENPRSASWLPPALCLYHSHRVNGVLTYTPIARWGR